jgi:N-acetylglucosamine-6-phosphate deacetylase
MNTRYITGGQVYVDRSFQQKTVAMEEGKLRLLPPDAPVSGEVYDAAGKKVVPGFIDIHTHGAVGVDVNGATAADLEKIGKFFAGNGTTAWLASVLTDTEEQTRWCIDQYREWKKEAREGAELLGIHLEGPFLAPAYKGAMPEHLLRQGDAGLLRSYQEQAEGGIRYLTVSPEVEGTIDMIPAARELGIVTAIGHSGADYDTAMSAIAAGAQAATHTFNAMLLLHQHRPAILGAVLESDVYCEAICDGRHLHPGIVRLLLKVKGLDQVVAITDSIMAAGLPDGKYHLGVNEVVVEDGDAKLASDGTRAGSTLTQDTALLNLLAFTGRRIEEILPLLTENPAKLAGVFDRKGSIADGKDADIVVLDGENHVEQVFVKGRPCKPQAGPRI